MVTEAITSVRSHRGGTILALGILALFFNSFGALVGLGLLIGLPLGIVGWIKANRDLREMETGVVDPSGRSQTQAGKVCAIVSLVLVGLWVLLLLLVIPANTVLTVG